MAGADPRAHADRTFANRHLEYALTWFGLAGALAAVYAALVRRRMKA
jgi:cytochrome oxidase assembly protein ShyY1